MAKNLVDIDVTLDGVILSRLMIKEYEKSYTNLPNANLPQELYLGLEAVFQKLTGEDTLPLTDSTFTISATEVKDEGYYEFNRLFSPTVYKNTPDEDNGVEYLFIQWGSYEIKLNISDDGVITTESGVTLKVRNKKLGKYDTPCLIATVKVGKKTFSMPFPVRVVEIETTADELEMLLESGDVESFLELVGSKGSGGSYKSFEGYTVKAGHLPLGEYEITDYRSYEHPQYGVRYYLQANTPSVEFPVTVGVKNEDGEWEDKDVIINSPFQIRSNGSIKNYMDANPIVDSENVATLLVHEKGEYNGHPTAKVIMRFTALEEDENAVDLNF